MPGAFLWDDCVAGTASMTATAGIQVATMPLSNLLDPQPRLRARLLGSAAAVLVDLGTAREIEAVALISTTLGPNATVRWRLGPAEALLEADPLFDLRYDTGAIAGPPVGWAFARASSGWSFDATETLIQAANNAPRFDYDPASSNCLGLLMEEQRTNCIRNPRAEGASAGTPGSVPTYWQGNGQTQIVGTGTENGIPYVDIRYAGTTGGTAVGFGPWFDQKVATVAAPGQTWTGSVFCKLVGGSLPAGWYLNVPAQAFNAGLTYVGNAPIIGTTPTSGLQSLAAVPLAQCRLAAVYGPLAANTAYLLFGFNVVVPASTPFDFTIRFGAPQLELGAVVSSPILPAAGSPAASTRSADRQAVTGLSVDAAAGFSMLVDYTGAIGGTGTIVPAGLVAASGNFADSTYLTQSAQYVNAGLTILDSVHGNYAPSIAVLAAEGTAVRIVATAGPAGVRLVRSSAAAVASATVPAFPGPLTTLGIGGAPWGGGPGTASGVARYRRFALYAAQLTAGQADALAATGSSLDATALAFDSGATAANTSDAAGGNVVLLAPATASGRYLRVDLADPSAGFIDIGRIVAGPIWRLTRAFAYGVQEGRLILDRRDRNPLTGAEFPVPALANPRVTRFTLPLLTTAEIKGQHRAMLRAMGAVGDALWIPDTGLSQAELNARSVWGAVAEAGAEALASRDSFPASSRSFVITERV